MLMKRSLLIASFIIMVHDSVNAQRQMESLDRGVVAVRYEENKVFVSWRSLFDDAPIFHLMYIVQMVT